jgi:hypothetical protein
MTSQSAPDINQLFQSAVDEGSLSGSSFNTLMEFDLGAQLQASFGTPYDQVQATEVFLLELLIDDSGSIAGAGNEDAVREGHNTVLDALNKSKSRDGILVSTQYLNGQVLNPWTPLDSAIRMDRSNYSANGGTPLYDMSVVALGNVIAKVQEFATNGVPVRSATCIITDGHDMHSFRHDERSVKTIVSDMLREEGLHIVAAIGIDDHYTDFRSIFGSMGIPDNWILTPGNSPSEIRRAFNVLSQSALRASQNAAGFSQTAASGFMTS